MTAEQSFWFCSVSYCFLHFIHFSIATELRTENPRTALLRKQSSLFCLWNSDSFFPHASLYAYLPNLISAAILWYSYSVFFFPLKCFMVGSYPHYPELTLCYETFLHFPRQEWIYRKKAGASTDPEEFSAARYSFLSYAFWLSIHPWRIFHFNIEQDKLSWMPYK